ncbi:FeoA domain-containing protein [Desulfobotulus sp. H1]|uniref:FeoA domain-containing protein n=1 Tax=Desulfobotulus pelophilus TaxID=2823377 RepID=A0ABT3N8N0_9BACT|nr:FeoA domain-containing protein [Desulfobotulus pelophilus]MCW7753556.1 FeoA domain-containing protein [Desulfobotulus pelophilus]
MTIKPMRRMRVNETAFIHEVLAEGELGRKLREMGLVPGAKIRITGRAPLKDPVALRIGDFTLTLRNNEADWIRVEERP